MFNKFRWWPYDHHNMDCFNDEFLALWFIPLQQRACLLEKENEELLNALLKINTGKFTHPKEHM